MQRKNSLMLFKDIQFNTAKKKMHDCLVKLAETTESPSEKLDQLMNFQKIFNKYLETLAHERHGGREAASKSTIDWPKIEPPRKEMIIDYDNLPALSDFAAKSAPAKSPDAQSTPQIPELTPPSSQPCCNGRRTEPQRAPESPSEKLLGMSIHELGALKKSNLLDKLVIIKLNGGLGTTMGCKGPKSLIEVRDDMTFLDLTVRQIEWLNETYGCEVPLVLMNSFYTDQEIDRIVKKYTTIDILTFNQNQFPRIEKETMLPIAMAVDNVKDQHKKDYWYPPGHGDLYFCLRTSGLLDGLLRKGKEYLFVSNIDNLGASVDLKILSSFDARKECEFMMELTAKTPADIKGGTLVNYDGQPRLLEVAQVPAENLEEFKSVRKFALFNTNNLWVRLKAIRDINPEKLLDMEIIANEKNLSIPTYNQTGPATTKIIQLEQAVGAAIKHFKGALGIKVPRSRFLPVKNCSDLLLLKSNLYSLVHGALLINPARSFQMSTPIVKLGDEHFKTIAQFENRFQSIPNVIELDHLTVSGDVTFGSNVTLKGSVIIIAQHGERINIPSGAVLENKIISGNLRIINH